MSERLYVASVPTNRCFVRLSPPAISYCPKKEPNERQENTGFLFLGLFSGLKGSVNII